MILKTNKLKANSKFQLLFIFFILTIAFSLPAQNQRIIDSLFNVLKKSKHDTTKADAYANLCWEFNSSNPDTALYFGNLGLKLAIKANFKKGIAGCCNNIGVVYQYQGNYPHALEYHQKSLQINDELGDKKGMSACYNNIGGVYVDQGNYPKAIECYQKSLKIKEELGDKKGMSNCYLNIGEVHRIQGNYSQALEYYQKSIKISEELKDKQGMANGALNIGNIYADQATTASTKKLAAYKFDKAFEYYLKSLKIFEELGDKKKVATCFNNMGNVYFDQNIYYKAFEYYQKSLKISEGFRDESQISICLINIGKVYYKIGNYKEAITYSTNGLNYAKKIGTLILEEDAYETLTDSYKALEDYKDALKNHELYKLVDEDIFNQEKNKQLAQMEAIYQNEKKQKEIEIKEVQLAKNEIVIKHQKTIKFAFIGGFVLVALLAFLILWNLQRKKRDNRIIATEKAKSDELLLNILPSETAEELKKYGRYDARPYDIVSVLFTDFKGFTEIAEKLSVEKLVAELDLCFRAFDQLMGKYNVEKIKTIGDSYMCAGGIPVPNTTNPIDVVKCGLEIQQFMEEYKEERIKKNEPYFELRIGVHTGPIVAGIVGLKKFAYDIWGDTVNIASRMESSGEVGKVNISGATYELVKDNFLCTYRGKIQAKNKGEIDMYFVEGIRNRLKENLPDMNPNLPSMC